MTKDINNLQASLRQLEQENLDLIGALTEAKQQILTLIEATPPDLKSRRDALDSAKEFVETLTDLVG